MTVFFISITFVMLNVVSGDTITLIMKEHIKPNVIENIREKMHLDDPAMIRFIRYTAGALKGDFSISYKLNRSVMSL